MTNKQQMRQHRLSNSRSYRMCRQISVYLDDYYLDGVIGLIPVAGGMVSTAMSSVFLYVAVFKIRSFRLAIIILFNSFKDFVIGLIPFAGMILDFFYKSNKQNFALLDGFAAGDEAVVRQVNRQTVRAVAGLSVLTLAAAGLIYLTVWIGAEIFAYFGS